MLRSIRKIAHVALTIMLYLLTKLEPLNYTFGGLLPKKIILFYNK